MVCEAKRSKPEGGVRAQRARRVPLRLASLGTSVTLVEENEEHVWYRLKYETMCAGASYVGGGKEDANHGGMTCLVMAGLSPLAAVFASRPLT